MGLYYIHSPLPQPPHPSTLLHKYKMEILKPTILSWKWESGLPTITLYSNH
jgi:hypothetical protein